MSATEIIKKLHENNIELSVDDGSLRVRGTKLALSDSELLELIRQNKKELIEIISSGAYLGSTNGLITVPPNLILADSAAIMPEMLLLADLSQEQIEEIVRGVPGGVGNVQDIYSLAPLQKGILFHHMLGGKGDPYLLSMLIGFAGRARVNDYLKALQAVIARHDILRTAFMWEGMGEPVQVVWRKAALPVEEVVVDEAMGDVAGQLYARFDPRGYRIDLRQAPLMRAYIAEDKEKERWLMMLLLHHLAGDHVTIEAVQREIELHLLGQADLLPAPLPFRNLVAQTRLGMREEEHEAFFRAMLGDVEEPTAPFGLLDAQGDGRGIEEASVLLDEELALGVREGARQLGVSTASVCHLGWAQVLARVSEREDVVFGTVLFGRMQGGVASEQVIGMFINTLPVRIRVGEEGVEASVRRMHRVLAELMGHEHASLALAQRCSSVPAPAPLFSALLNYRHSRRGVQRNLEEASRAWAGIERLRGEERTSYPFALSVDDLGEGLRLTAQAPGWIDPKRVCEYMATALGNLVKALATSPGTAVRTLEVMPKKEREQILNEWNRTEVEYPQRSVHELFEEQVERMPEAVAVEYEGRQLSYAELNRRANQLGHYLRKQGVGPEVRVGICVERSLEMVVGLLGILKAGGAYVPLDASYPQERLEFMVKDVQAAVLLTQTELLKHLPQSSPCTVCLDEKWERIAQESEKNLATNGDRETLAYVIYTSGSTGRPKGVGISHRGLSNLVYWHIHRYQVNGNDRMTQFSTFGFDAAVFEVWPALAAGAGLYIVSDALRLDPHALLEWLAKKRITITFLPTPMAETMLRLSWPEETSLRFLLTGGDQLHQIPRQSHSFVLMNHYGPTENSVAASVQTVRWGIDDVPPIGTPIANTQIYVTDKTLEPVPVGVGGELYIGGQGVARGYVNRPDLTAERFIPDPFSGMPGTRLYRTGDQVRWRSDGALEFMGRLDHQVKLRGYRIELGEIENTLMGHGGVEQALVVVRGAGLEQRLVAYIVPAQGTWPNQVSAVWPEDELQEALKRQLPEYMVPSAFVLLEAFPLTANGKVDRNALAEPESAESEDKIGPRTPEEEILSGIFAGVLKLDRVGVEQNFFEAGGHSLLATQVISRVRNAFNVELPLRALFEAPTVAGLAERVRSLRGAAPVAASALVHVGRESKLPLSFAQQRLWFLHQLEPESVAYNILLGVRLSGGLNREALEWSLNSMVKRHEVLRTTFTIRNGSPIQAISAGFDLKVEIADLCNMDGPEREAEAKRLAEEEGQRGFDLQRGPLVRVKLLRLGEQEHVLLVTMHHIVSDGWSLGIMAREIGQLYGAYVRGEESPLLELPVQYADYAVWQREWLQGEVLEEQLKYWRKQLAEMEPLDLPTDHLRPAVMSRQGAAKFFAIERHLSEQLKELSRREGVTLFMSLLAGVQMVLSRYAGQQDIAVGTDIANRNRVEIEGLIGFFVNQLVLRTRLGGNPDFREVLRRVRRVTLDAYQHQDVPFEKLVEELQPERDLGRSPLFAVKLVLQNVAQQELQLPELRVSNFTIGADLAKVDLQLTLWESSEGLSGELRYARGLYEAETMERLLRHLQWVLEQTAAEPERRIGEMSLLRGAEREQVLVEWNRTACEYPQRSVHELFAEQAERTPEAVAVEYEGRRWSYRELNERANQLAHYLHELGVGPEVLVGICVERSLEMVVGLLGILKAGGAYVPLDPEYPSDRLAFMLEDSGVPVLLSQSHLLNRLPAVWGQIVCLDSQWEQIAEQSTVNLEISLETGNAAYVVYTSGSSGRPKGVLNTHGGLSNLAAEQRRLFGVSRESGVLQFASLSFDAATSEWAMALTGGARLVLVKREELLDPEGLVRLLEEREISVVTLPPSVLGVMPEAELRKLRTIVVAGEACWTELVSKWGEGRRMLNAYGPSETTVCATVSEPLVKTGKPDIGKPIGNTVVYVLDENLQGVPVGVGGELYIGGQGVARGYRNRPELTAEKFIPNPFSGKEGERMYRTGDRGRWRSDGTLEFLGRLDDQVKVRGYRIELGEIEAALLECAGVEQAVVIARGEGAKRQLVAYVADRSGAAEDKPEAAAIRAVRAELGEQLRRRLPEYMVPGIIVQLAEMPLTANGKVDRKALPSPDLENGMGAEQIAPRSAEEEILIGIFTGVLNRERVGVKDNFFEMGGHSLLAAQVIARVQSTFNMEVPLRALFEAPTVAGLAERVRSLRGTGQVAPPPIMRVSRGGELELSYAQQRLWFLTQMGPGNSSYHIPIGVRLRGELDVEALRKGIREIVRRHEALRTRFEAVGGKPRQIIEEEINLDLEVVELGGREGGERERLLREKAVEEAQKLFDLEKGPMVRVKLLRLGEEEHALLMTMHHIVSDGVSMGVVVREMTELYAAYREGRESPLAELGVQYADYAAWQRSWLKEEVLEEQAEYWKRELEGVRPLDMPVDRALGPETTLRSGSSGFRLGKETSARLKELSRREEATIFMTLMAGFQVLLYRYSGQENFAVGTPITGRNEVETEGLVGFFVNTLVLAASVGGGPSFQEVLRRVKEKTLGAYVHQDIPFERLVDALQVERNVNRTPLFQAVLAFENEGLGGELKLGGGVRVEALKGGGGIAAKFELLLSVRDMGEQLAGGMEYFADVWDEGTINTMMRRMEHLLEEAVEGAGQCIDGIALMSEAEEREVVESGWRGWSGGEVREGERTLAELVREHARDGRERRAVVGADGGGLSYGELERQSNRVGKRLRGEGVKAGTVVGISLGGMSKWVTAAVGVLKAGGAFVPLEVGEVESRRRQVVREAGVEWVVTEEGRERELAGLGVKCLKLDGEGEEEGIEGASESGNGSGRQRGGELGCVLYRSSGLGRPESIWITQGTLCGKGVMSVGMEDRVGLSLSFDQEGGGLEMFRVLAAGGCVVEVQRGAGVAPRRVAGRLRDHGVTVWWAEPVLVERVGLEFPWGLKSVRQIMCEEEMGALEELLEVLPQEVVQRVYGVYGTVETGGGGALYPLGGLRGGGARRRMEMEQVASGKRMYLLDSELREVPEGVVGEICVGGEEQVWGYGGVERTAERWVPDPGSETRGGRMYRSGDYGRKRRDGSVERVGRRDRRSVVSGVRVYEEEIEAALRKRGEVGEVAVAIGEVASGQRGGRERGRNNNKDNGRQGKRRARITAWVVKGEEWRQEKGRLSEELLRGLKQELPEVMIPEKLVEMEELPRRVDGEINRGALLRQMKEEEEAREYRAPGTPAEEKLVQVWEETLDRRPVGIHDNFFSIGGDSLLAIQLLARTNDAFQVEVPLRRLFELPTVAQLAPIMAQLKEAGGRRKPTIKRISRGGELELSYAQQRLWFLTQMGPGNSSYHIPIGVRLRGELDVEALRKGIREIVRRHEALRTRFEAVGGKPRQIIEEEINLDLEVVELGGREGGERERLLREKAVEEAQKLFDLEKGPMVRVKLLRLGEEEHALLMTMHHIVSDGVSMGVVVREMTELYAAYREGRESPLAELGVQYADYAAWQRSWLKEEVLEEQAEYWKRELEGVRPLDMPVDRALGPETTLRSGSSGFRLGKETSARLKELSRREEATIFMTLMAGFQVLLYRYSGQENFAVGTPITGRNEVETEGLVGFFVNTLVLAASVGGGPSFQEVLRRVKEKTLGAYVHQDIPFERLVDALQVERNVNRTPLFQAVLAFENEGLGGELKLGGGVRVEALKGGGGIAAKFELLLSVRDMGEQLAGGMEYFADVWDEGTINTMMRRMEHLLEEAVEGAGQCIDGIALMSEAEEREVVESGWRGWSGGEVREGERTLAELVREHARDGRERRAVVGADGGGLSYGELERQSNRVGKRLRGEGVKAGTVVGISLGGMSKWVTAAVGVLKAGGAFVPLEVGEVESRRRQVVREAGVEWVVTEEGRERELAGLGVKCLKLDGEGEEEGIEGASESGNGSGRQRGGELGCVLYRSSGLGRPESIWITQGTLCGKGVMSVGMEDRVGLSLSFDQEGGGLEMFRVLAAGGCVVEVQRGAGVAPRRVAGRLRDHGVTVWWAEPVLVERVGLEFPWGLKSVRQIMCEEEMGALEELLEVLPQEVVQRVYGVYGTVETGGGGALYPLGGLRGGGARRRMEMEQVASGKRMYLLDSELREVPEGVVGEICVGGEEQVWGYGGVERTAERWVPDPGSETRGGRMYRSGDYGRKRRDGSVERVGRRDRRSVVSGVRVYEEEIEAALRKRGEVGEVAVAIGEVASGQRGGRERGRNNNKDNGRQGKRRARITAWVVKGEEWRQEKGRLSEELLRGLKQELPEVMIPEKLVEMEELPRRVDGEINRGALLRQMKEEEEAREYRAPGTPAEEKLVQVWEETLDRRPVGIHDNFFSIGGDSLLAIQLLARTNDAFQVEVPLRRLFELPTVAQLAPIMAQLKEAGGRRKPTIKRISRGGELELSYAQQRLWFLTQMGPGNSSYHIPIGVRLRGELDVEALRKGIREIVRRHEALRTRFEAVGGKPRQIIEEEINLDLEVVELGGREGGERERLLREKAVEEAQKLFDLEKGPMVRVKLLRLGEEEHALLMTMHHIVSDGVSMGVVVREMTELYAAYREGRESPLAELGVQYADYAAWQRSWLKEEVLEEQAEYWKRELEGVRPLDMPVDRALGPETTLRSGSSGFRLGKETSARLKELSRREEATIFMTLMAGFQVLLYRYSGQENFAVGTPITGRNEVETEGLVGFFVNTLVLAASVGGGPSFQEVLRRVKEKTLGAYVHQDIPFERLVDALQVERNVNRTPLFQAVLAFENEGLGGELKLGGGVRVEALKGGGGIAAKFELLLSVRDMGEQLAGGMEYFADVWDEGTINTMMRRMEHLLEEAVEGAGQCIDGIALMSEAEEREVVESGWRGWSGGEVREGERTLAELVREHARDGRERRAVVGVDGGGLSYGELERQSNRVGKRLRGEGVKAGTVVGISLGGMSKWVTAAVGVLKAGGAFVPLEVGEVESRRRQVVREAGVEWVVTEEGRERELAGLGVKCLKLDGEGEEEGIEGASESGNGSGRQRGGELGCVLYRSSGLGRPESIWITQGTLCGKGVMSVGMEDRVGLSLSFDQEGGGLEMFRVLAAGGCVVEVQRGAGVAPRRVAGRLRDHGVTVWWAEPVLVERVGLEFPWGLKSVRQIMCEEEMGALEELLEVLPQEVVQRVYGVYGTVETGGGGALYPLGGLRGGGARRRMEMEQVASGKRMYLLDSELREVPEGVVGEICVGGEEQVWGYGGVERTAERWVPDPGSETRGGRMYCSGDYGRKRRDGSVERVGRRDRRSVVSGVRVYEEEIEAALRKRGEVGEVAVAIGEVASGQRGGRERGRNNNKDNGRQGKRRARITAWVVKGEEWRQEKGRLSEELLRGLKQELPEVMIPEKLVEMEELPRRVDGEINRGALLRQMKEEEEAREYRAPGTPAEEKLVQVWEETLDRRPVGIHDNFFSIGGDSLLAIQLLARTNDAFQVEVPLRRLFELPTVAQLAPIMAQLKENPEEQTYGTSPSLVPLRAVAGGENLFCFHAVKGGVTTFNTLIELLPGVSMYGLQSEGLSRSIRYTTIESMAAYYVEIIRSVQKKGPYSLIGQSSGGLLAFEAAHILSRMGEEVAAVLLLDTMAPGSLQWNATDLDLINALADGKLDRDDDQEALSRLQGDEQLVYAFEQLKKRGHVPSNYGLDIGRSMLEVLKNNLTATTMYAPEPYGGHVVLIAAEASPVENIEAWKTYVSGSLDIAPFAGQHKDLLVEPFVRETAKHIQRYMGEAQKRSLAVNMAP